MPLLVFFQVDLGDWTQNFFFHFNLFSFVQKVIFDFEEVFHSIFLVHNSLYNAYKVIIRKEGNFVKVFKLYYKRQE